MKILIISGFLGAGKTTFIKEMIQKTGKNFAILENEYGEVGIDGKLLEEDNKDGELKIYELTEGCICCSIKADFSNSVLTVANALDPEYLIVEPTGVGKLSAIIDNISKISYEKISLLQPIAIIEIDKIDKNLKKYEDIYKNQIQNAKHILFSKCEASKIEDFKEAKQKILSISKDAIIYEKHYKDLDSSFYKEILSDYLIGKPSKEEKNIDEMELENIGIKDIYLECENDLLFFLNKVICGFFGEIIRAKGYLKCGNSHLRFDVVDDTYYITGTDIKEESQAVFIGKNLKNYNLKNSFKNENKNLIGII